MNQRRSSRAILVTTWLVSIVLCAYPVLIHPTSAKPEGTTRTYYVATDEVQWDYAPSGRDEAMGMEFDEIGKAFTESGPHRIGHVYKKAIYREYTDATFSTLKKRGPEEQYLGLLGPVLRGAVGDTIKVVFKNNASHPLWFIKTKRRRVFDAGGASLEGSALHGVVFDRYARPQKRAGEARLPGSGRESPSDPDSEGVRFGAGNC
jgi:hypothetical protein